MRRMFNSDFKSSGLKRTFFKKNKGIQCLITRKNKIWRMEFREQQERVFSARLRYLMEKAMATHSSTLAWKIPRMEEPRRLQSMGSRSQAQLSDFTFTFHFHALEKEMATHSSVLAWRTSGMVEPGGLPSMGHRVGHN